MSLRTLLELCLLLGPGALCLVPVWRLPKPHVIDVEALSAKRTLLVSWLANRTSLLGATCELQIGRTENRTIVFSANITVCSLGKKVWTWTSDLPLECVDHSVRMRYLYNQTVPSPWSNWKNNSGAQPADKTKMFPFQQVLREGDRAMFCCVPPRGVPITGMTLNDRKYPLIHVTAAVRAISVENLTIPTTLIKAVALGCIESGQRKLSVWNYVSFPPQKPRNLSCVTSDLTTVTCSWDPGRRRDPYDRNEQTHTLHVQNSDLSPVVCQQSWCSFQAVPHLEEYNISVVVKDLLGEETESYRFSIRDRVAPVVKWHNLFPGVATANLSWTIRGNLTVHSLLCQVTADPSSSRSSRSSSSSSSSSSELSCDAFGGICKVTLTRLSPSCRYSVRVRCSAVGRLWGPWTQAAAFQTYPAVTLDVWRRINQLSDLHSRQLTLLWTPRVSGSAPDLTIRGYVVEVSREDTKRSLWRDGGETQAEFSIGSGRYDVTIRAVVRAGPNVSAHITVPQRQDGGGEIPPVWKRLHGAAAAAFNLSWGHLETATCGYTVEWCIPGDRDPCALQWVKVPAGTNMLSLPAGNFKAGCRFTFIIYGCTESGHRLLEIQTGYTQELQSVEAPNLGTFTSDSSSVTLEWHYNEDDEAHPAFITGYLVTVQEVQQNTLTDLLNVSVSDPRRKSVTVDGLQPNRDYVLSVSALTRQGPGLATSITIRTRPSYSAHLVKILTPVLLLLFCALLLWPRRNVVKTRLVGIFAYPAGMNVRAPDLDSVLQEMVKRLQSEEVEECRECHIEILDTGALLEATSEADALTRLAPGSSRPEEPPPTQVPIQVDYCPQSAPLPLQAPPASH
uniref:Class I helical cytokine receptor number 28 n=1 Tax=Tetraodon nigroviridis TaxID=99883 RepID=Q6UAM8_TETNG|nr:class I helical cytokine receptor number 28 [Tetraodon nigroviridis]